MGSSTQIQRRYILGFDGIRALAVLGVILYHIFPKNFTGGYLGVPIFFVVSGYLITDLLLQELENNHTINLKKFYVRRIKRLYPALLFMLIVTSAYITLFNPGALLGLRATVLTNLTYLYNFWEIDHGQSYFQQFSAPSPFTHLWSLSVEGQFYLVWPIIVLILARLKVKRFYVFSMLLSGSVISAICLAVYFDPTNINRAYYGTDTRLFAILLGASLAYIWPSNHLKVALAPKNQHFLNTVSFISLILLVVGFVTLNGEDKITYFGGMYLFTISASFFVATIVHPKTWLVKILDNQVFNWIGTRSYGIYLYQYPVLVFFEQKISNYQANLLLYVPLEFLVIGVISELSYRYLEVPIKRSTLASWHVFSTKLSARYPKTIGSVIIFFIILGTAIGGLVTPQAATNYQTPLQKQLALRHNQEKQRNKKIIKQVTQKKFKVTKKIILAPIDKKLANKYNLSASDFLKLKRTNVSGIGDSMLVNVGPSLQAVMPIIIDGHVGRQASLGPAIIQTQLNKRQLMDNVLVMLGTNGNIYPETIKQMMHMLGTKREIFWVNNYVERPWTNENNNLLKKAAKKYPNLHVVNWHRLANRQHTWFGPDGIHPNQTGDIYLTMLIAKNIAKFGL